MFTRVQLRLGSKLTHFVKQPKRFRFGLGSGNVIPMNEDFWLWWYQPKDFSWKGIRSRAMARKWKEIKKKHMFQENLQYYCGPDLAAANCVVDWGGAVKFKGTKWLQGEAVPQHFVEELKVEAIDLSDTYFMYESFENLVDLKELAYFRASRCEYLTDWCLPLFGRFPNLVHLDVSECPRLTERGLSSLHLCKNLRELNVDHLSSVRCSIPTLGLLLEDCLPRCHITGLEWEHLDPETYVPPSEIYTLKQRFLDESLARENETYEDLDFDPFKTEFEARMRNKVVALLPAPKRTSRKEMEAEKSKHVTRDADVDQNETICDSVKQEQGQIDDSHSEEERESVMQRR